MKIVHVSISAPFIDNWGYQENLLPKYLQMEGTKNYIIASANDFPAHFKSEIVNKGTNYVYDGIVVRRIPTKKISTSFAFTKGLHKVLEEIKPDVIFHHNLNCTSMPICARYAKRKGIPMVCDNHADTINMTKHRLWAWFYYRLLIGFSCKIHKNQIYKAYGVTHARCDFIHDYFGLAKNKIDFLPIGADVDLADTINSKTELRQLYGFTDERFIIVSGGKMGIGKGTDNLIRAVEELHNEYPMLSLVLFGKFEDDETASQANNSQVTTVYGWCDRVKTLQLLKLADVACWPIHHTTLIEDAVSVCTPLILRKTGTTEHLIDGNGVWIENGTKEEIKQSILNLLNQKQYQNNELLCACKKLRKTISYHTVAGKLLIDLSKK